MATRHDTCDSKGGTRGLNQKLARQADALARPHSSGPRAFFGFCFESDATGSFFFRERRGESVVGWNISYIRAHFVHQLHSQWFVITDCARRRH